MSPKSPSELRGLATKCLTIGHLFTATGSLFLVSWLAGWLADGRCAWSTWVILSVTTERQSGTRHASRDENAYCKTTYQQSERTVG